MLVQKRGRSWEQQASTRKLLISASVVTILPKLWIPKSGREFAFAEDGNLDLRWVMARAAELAAV
jgi:hypothetical protein